MNCIHPEGVPLLVHNQDASLQLIIPTRQVKITIIDDIFSDETGVLDIYWNDKQLLGIKRKDVVFTISSYGLQIRHNTMDELEYMISTISSPEMYHSCHVYGYMISRVATNSRVLSVPSTWKCHLYIDLLSSMTNVDAILSIDQNTYEILCHYNRSSPGYIWLYVERHRGSFRSERYRLALHRTEHTITDPLLFYGSNISCVQCDSHDAVIGLQYPLKSIFLSHTHEFSDIDILTCT